MTTHTLLTNLATALRAYAVALRTDETAIEDTALALDDAATALSDIVETHTLLNHVFTTLDESDDFAATAEFCDRLAVETDEMASSVA